MGCQWQRVNNLRDLLDAETHSATIRGATRKLSSKKGRQAARKVFYLCAQNFDEFQRRLPGLTFALQQFPQRLL